MQERNGYICLDAGGTSLVLACHLGQRPSLLYWGPRLSLSDPDTMRAMLTRQHAPGSADVEVPGSLINELGSGVAGQPGFSAHRSGEDWASVFAVTTVRRPAPNTVELVCRDENTGVQATHIIHLNPDSQILVCETEIENIGDSPLSIERCSAASLPLDPRATRLFGFTGRWAGEFQLEPIPPFTGSYVRDNRKGRTSHDSFPALICGAAETNEQNGLCFGFHLGWSGNSRVCVDRLSDGRSFVQMGELFFPGEMSLNPGETYRSPCLYAGVSDQGFSALSRLFHSHVQTAILNDRIAQKPRPIHYNTWEAVYFDHDRSTLFELAEKAADVGAERFILDDGWFGGRRGDKAGLGDWWPSPDVYPDGLGPLVEHVTGLGMEFGLWFEPEMVNPDSDLYRAHPDWVLQADGVDQVPFRGQYTLDLSRPEVCDYLFDRLHKVLSEYEISYIKWDMNRDIHHPGSRGRPAGSQQTRALYALIERLRAHHPDLEIESCSSGGGRADYGILRHTDRIWTSDSNDALDRQRIQRGASHFFPLAVMGAHVGPETCHITGRRLSMQLRVATALFGHMGMELDLLQESAADLNILKAGIALHKRHRDLIHTGEFHRLETPDHVNAIGVVSDDQSEALFSWCNLTGHRETLPGRVFFAGLDAAKSYRTRIVWPDPVRSISRPSILEGTGLAGEGLIAPGEALMHLGLQIPLLHPETCLIFHLQKI
ncbi:MAG: alpha-galactosidase [Henriciella sp.]|nr:alpha-galactosidase [Henriciella sp.]